MDIFTDRYLPLIEKSGKTDSELEKEIGLPRSIIYDWRKGRNKSYKKYADKFAAYFNVSVSWMLGIEENEKSAPSEESALDSEIVQLFAALTADKQAEALNYLKYLASKDKP